MLGPIEEGTAVVYVIDTTFSTNRYRSSIVKTLGRLNSKHKSTPNVRVAMVLHGITGDFNTDAVREMLDRPANKLTNFKAPGKFPVSRLPRFFTKNQEQLPRAIDRAREVIAEECPSDVDLNDKPWCQRKVIVAMGDGDPGLAPDEYFANPEDDQFQILLDTLNDASIQLNTLCVGSTCTDGYMLCGDTVNLRYYRNSGSTCEDFGGPGRDGLIGHVLMRQIAQHTGGEFEGWVR